VDKTAKIVAAALFAAGLTQVTPALAVQTTADGFMQGLSSDFAMGNLGGVQAKLDDLKNSGFEGIVADNQKVTLARLIEILGQVQAGNVSGGKVAAKLEQIIAHAEQVRFLVGDIRLGSANLGGGPAHGAMFPAGSAG
jgi:hypothetical protein